MSKYDLILESINQLSNRIDNSLCKVNHRIDEINEFLERDTKRHERLQQTQAKQGHQIAKLTETVDKLVKDRQGVIWESKDHSSVGIDKETACEAFREIGFDQRTALKLLDAAGRLRVDQNSDGSVHRTKKVRISPTKVVRCVVVFVGGD